MSDSVVAEAFHRIDGPGLKLVHQRLSVRICSGRSIPRLGFARLSRTVHELQDKPFVTVWLHDEVGLRGLAVVPVKLNPQCVPVR